MAKGEKSALAIAKENKKINKKLQELSAMNAKLKDYSSVNNVPFTKESEPQMKAFTPVNVLEVFKNIEPLSIVSNLNNEKMSTKSISELFPVTNEGRDISEGSNEISRRTKSMLDFIRPLTGIDIGSGRLTPNISLKNKSIGLQFKMPLGDY